MANKIGSYIYKALFSIFFIYLFIRSIVIFLDYAMNHDIKFSAFTEIEIKRTTDITNEKILQIIRQENTTIQPTENSDNIVIVARSRDYDSLEQIKDAIIVSLKEKLPQESVTVLRADIFPQPVSRHFFRLQMTAFIPAFIMAIFWFIHVYRWYHSEFNEPESKDESKLKKK